MAAVKAVLETPRLRLVPLASVDAEELHAAITESLAELSPWMKWVHPPPALADTRGFLEHCAQVLARGDGEAHELAGMDTETGRLLLCVGIFRVDRFVPCYEFGFWRRTSAPARGGLMVEAVRAVTEHAIERLGVRRLQFKFNARNGAVAALVRRVGFVYEGRLHNESVDEWNGELRDVDMFAHTPETWRRFVERGGA